ncbi:ribonuclease P protein component [candidate division KSB1 bacterium]|nr:ribonuclease P protein component [candidate division KSB1 bacterium]
MTSALPPNSIGGAGGGLGTLPTRRIAFAATRAVGNSVVRHRHIRKLREYYRLNKDKFPVNYTVLLHIRARISDWNIFEKRLTELLRSIN